MPDSRVPVPLKPNWVVKDKSRKKKKRSIAVREAAEIVKRGPASAPAPAQATPITPVRTAGRNVYVVPRYITVGGEEIEMTAEQLIRMIKQVTQTIGEYKSNDNVYGKYVVPALRKARSDMVSDLEHHFGIHWQIDETGKSIFSM